MGDAQVMAEVEASGRDDVAERFPDHWPASVLDQLELGGWIANWL